MEKVEDFNDSEEVFENEIDLYFNEFCEKEKIENMTEAPQSIFYAALIYVYNHTFKNTNRLKLKGKLQGYNNNNYNNQYSNINNSNCNSYNYEYLNYIADYYIYICYKYNKICTISGYCKLTGINEVVVYNWANERTKADRLSASSYDLWEKLAKDYEASGEARLWSGKNPVGHLAAMNHHFNWNLPGVSRETNQRQALTAADIRQQLQNSADSALLSDNLSQKDP